MTAARFCVGRSVVDVDRACDPAYSHWGTVTDGPGTVLRHSTWGFGTVLWVLVLYRTGIMLYWYYIVLALYRTGVLYRTGIISYWYYIVLVLYRNGVLGYYIVLVLYRTRVIS